MPWQAGRGLFGVVGAAVLMTALNGVKPLHIDDPFSYRIAEQSVLSARGMPFEMASSKLLGDDEMTR